MTIVNPEHFKGWKYREYKDKFNYVQWIYMNLIQDDIAAILTYGVASEFAPGVMAARVYRDKEIPKIEGVPPMKEVLDLRDYNKHPTVLKPSPTDSSIVIDDDSLTVDPANKDLFHAKGTLQDKKTNLEWNLTYERLLPQIDAMDAESVGWFHNRFYSEWLSWQIKMPATRVSGTIKVNDKEYAIDTMGYMDSNWGQWLIIDAQWNWLHTFGTHEDQPYAIAAVDIRNDPDRGELYIATPEETARLSKNKKEFEFDHKAWQKDRKTGHSRPTLTKIVGQSLEGHEVQLEARNLVPYTLRQKFPPPVYIPRSWDMLESLVKVTGTIKTPDGKTIEVNSKGFKEYGTTGWIPDSWRKFLNNLFDNEW